LAGDRIPLFGGVVVELFGEPCFNFGIVAAFA